jgi:hypothetical protein
MSKSAAERKAAQRQRQAEEGLGKLELTLDQQELEMLRQNCATRRPFREPYDMNEYISLLIRKDNAELESVLGELKQKRCGKCGDALPGDPDGCYFYKIGDSACWQTFGWHETKIKL